MIRGSGYENSPVTVNARIVDIDGEPLVAADVTSILAKAWHTESETLTATLTPSPTDVFHALASWGEDETGGNYSHTFSGTCFPNPGNYRLETKVTPVSGDPFYVVAAVQVEGVYSE